MVFKSLISQLAIDYAVKKERGFKPSKKTSLGPTVFQHCMSICVGLLVLNATKISPISDDREFLIDRVAHHYSEHIMFTTHHQSESLAVISEMITEINETSTFQFETSLNEHIRLARAELPVTALKEIVAHIAMFLRLDPIQSDQAQKTAFIRDEIGRLLGSVSPEDIEIAFNQSAGYMIEITN